MNRELLLKNEHFLDFLAMVQSDFQKLHHSQPVQDELLRREQASLASQCSGWLQSLGNPSLSSIIRHDLEQQYEAAQCRAKEIELSLSGRKQQFDQLQELIDPNAIADKLEQLSTMLAGDNASATNLMLAQHIEGIYCDESGQVVVRCSKIGALSGIMDMLPRGQSPIAINCTRGEQNVYRAVPRRRARLDVGAAIEDEELVADANDFGVDPNRFSGLGDEWFHEDVFQVPEKLSWAEEHAREVAEFRLTTKLSMELTARHFGKTIPTIRAALRYAKEKFGIDALGKEVSRVNLPNWSRAHAQEVAAFFLEPGATKKAAVEKFAKSEPTIRKAVEFAKKMNKHKVSLGDASPIDERMDR